MPSSSHMAKTRAAVEEPRSGKQDLMTLQEDQQTPKTMWPQELIDGVLQVADAPFVHHQRVVFRLARAMQAHAEAVGAGEVFVAPIDVVLDRERPLVLQPDVLFVSAERAAIVRDRIDG